MRYFNLINFIKGIFESEGKEHRIIEQFLLKAYNVDIDITGQIERRWGYDYWRDLINNSSIPDEEIDLPDTINKTGFGNRIFNIHSYTDVIENTYNIIYTGENNVFLEYLENDIKKWKKLEPLEGIFLANKRLDLVSYLDYLFISDGNDIYKWLKNGFFIRVIENYIYFAGNKYYIIDNETYQLKESGEISENSDSLFGSFIYNQLYINGFPLSELENLELGLMRRYISGTKTGYAVLHKANNLNSPYLYLILFKDDFTFEKYFKIDKQLNSKVLSFITKSEDNDNLPDKIVIWAKDYILNRIYYDGNEWKHETYSEPLIGVKNRDNISYYMSFIGPLENATHNRIYMFLTSYIPQEWGTGIPFTQGQCTFYPKGMRIVKPPWGFYIILDDYSNIKEDNGKYLAFIGLVDAGGSYRHRNLYTDENGCIGYIEYVWVIPELSIEDETSNIINSYFYSADSRIEPEDENKNLIFFSFKQFDTSQLDKCINSTSYLFCFQNILSELAWAGGYRWVYVSKKEISCEDNSNYGFTIRFGKDFVLRHQWSPTEDNWCFDKTNINREQIFTYMCNNMDTLENFETYNASICDYIGGLLSKLRWKIGHILTPQLRTITLITGSSSFVKGDKMKYYLAFEFYDGKISQLSIPAEIEILADGQEVKITNINHFDINGVTIINKDYVKRINIYRQMADEDTPYLIGYLEKNNEGYWQVPDASQPIETFIDNGLSNQAEVDYNIIEKYPNKQILTHKNRLILISRTDYNNPNVIQYSGIDTPEGIVSENTRPIESGDGDYLTAGISVGDYLYLFKSSKIYAILGDVETGQLLDISKNIGCKYKHLITSFNNIIYFLNDDGIYALLGRSIRNLSYGRLDNYFNKKREDSLDFNNLDKGFAVVDVDKAEIKFYVPQKRQPPENPVYCNLVIIYNTQFDYFRVYEYHHRITTEARIKDLETGEYITLLGDKDGNIFELKKVKTDFYKPIRWIVRTKAINFGSNLFNKIIKFIKVYGRFMNRLRITYFIGGRRYEGNISFRKSQTGWDEGFLKVWNGSNVKDIILEISGEDLNEVPTKISEILIAYSIARRIK